MAIPFIISNCESGCSGTDPCGSGGPCYGSWPLWSSYFTEFYGITEEEHWAYFPNNLTVKDGGVNSTINKGSLFIYEGTGYTLDGSDLQWRLYKDGEQIGYFGPSAVEWDHSGFLGQASNVNGELIDVYVCDNLKSSYHIFGSFDDGSVLTSVLTFDAIVYRVESSYEYNGLWLSRDRDVAITYEGTEHKMQFYLEGRGWIHNFPPSLGLVEGTYTIDEPGDGILTITIQ